MCFVCAFVFLHVAMHFPLCQVVASNSMWLFGQGIVMCYEFLAYCYMQ